MRDKIRKSKISLVLTRVRKREEHEVTIYLVLVESPFDTRDTTECRIRNSRKDGGGDVDICVTLASGTAIYNLHNNRLAIVGVRYCRSEGDVAHNGGVRIAIGQAVTTDQDRANMRLHGRLEETTEAKNLSPWRVGSTDGIAVGLFGSTGPGVIQDMGYSSSVSAVIVSITTCTQALAIVSKVPGMLLGEEWILLVVQRVRYTPEVRVCW